ncbi:MAG: membrane protein insertion efficiency factor YidD [Thermogutta sp.]
MADHSFGPKYRIRSKKEIDRVFARRCSVADDSVILYGCENGLEIARLAILASRKLGKTVFRNRWKRLIREAFRQNKEEIPVGIDYVVIPKGGVQPDFHQLFRSFPRLGKRLKRRLERSARETCHKGTPIPPAPTPPKCQGGGTGYIKTNEGSASCTPTLGGGGSIPTKDGEQSRNEAAQRAVASLGMPAGGLLRLVLRGLALIDAAVGSVLILLVVIYQWTISPLFGRCCRFEPTCSHYFIQAVRKYGVVVGSVKGVGRILRCHPWHPGGYDPP